MSDILRNLEPGKHGSQASAAEFMQLRRVPLQPEGVPIGQVFMGATLGYLPWSRFRPRAGDTVAVVGLPGQQVVIGRERPVMRDPIFFGRCSCRCPGSSTGGVIFYLTDAQDTTVLLVVDGETGAVAYLSTLPEVILGAGIAVDPEAPHDLYILDDRQNTLNLSVDGVINPDPAKQWYFMLKYTLSGNSYAFSTIELMPGFPFENPFTDSVNSLAVIDGVCWIALASMPATLRRWSGSGFTDLVLTEDGDPYEALLLGPVVRVGTRPAPTSALFVLGQLVEGTFEIIQFNPETGAIARHFSTAELTMPKALLTVCNRLYAFQALSANRSDPGDPGEEEDEDGGGGGGDEEA